VRLDSIYVALAGFWNGFSLVTGCTHSHPATAGSRLSVPKKYAVIFSAGACNWVCPAQTDGSSVKP
jgi:hypothetical protein